MEALRAEIAPVGIHATVVNPGFFRTELLTEPSKSYAEPSVAETSAAGRWSPTGSRRRASRRATRRSSRRRSRASRARSRRRGASSPALAFDA